ncbi:MAG: phage tail tape measure protein [Oscillospiraceae bacterium]|nr:phage tail tape measure protein [Oscillospiraceae bacterium]
MAGRIAGITIDIDGNTSKLQDSLKKLDGSLRTTQNNLKDVNKLLKLDPGNTELLVQKQKNLQTAIKGTGLRLNELKTALEGVEEGSAEWDALQREIIATEQELKGLEDEYKAFGSVGAQQVAAVGQAMQDVGGKIEGVGQKLAPLSAAAAGIVASLAGLGYAAITGADDLNTLAKQTGLSTAEIQKMQYASDLVDVSFDSIAGALRKLKSKMDPANETFKQLGVSVTNADGSLRDASDVFYDSIDALSKIENETERDQVAMELFGKSADELAGIIDDGGAAMKQFGKDAEDLGLILDQETLDSLNEMNDTIDTLKARFTKAFAKLGATVAKVFGPALAKAADFAQKLSDKIANLSPEQVKLASTIAGVVAVIAPLTIGIGKVVGGIGKVMTTAPKIVSTVKLITGALSPTGLMIAGIAAAAVALGVVIYKNWDKIKAWTQEMGDKISGVWSTVKESVSNAVNSLRDAVSTAWENIKTAVSNSEFIQGVVAAWESVKTGVQTAVRAVRATVVGVWNRIREAVSNNAFIEGVVAGWESLKAGVQAAVRAARTTVVTTWNTIKSRVQTLTSGIAESVTSKFEEAKEAASTAVENARTAVIEKWNAIKSSVSTIGQGIVNTARSKFNLVKANAVSIFGGVKTAIEEKITAAKDAVSRIWDEIKGFFTDAIQLKFKLPKITMGTKDFQTFAGTISIPWPEIKWEKKGYTDPVMFTKPTVLQTPQGYYGFGDGHGAEIVLGLDRLRELVATSSAGTVINVYPPQGANVEQIAEAVEQRLVAAQRRRIRVYA